MACFVTTLCDSDTVAGRGPAGSGRFRDEGTNTATFTPRGICLMSHRRCSDRSPIESSLRPRPAPNIQRRTINPFTRNTLTGSVRACTPGLYGMVPHPAPPQPVRPPSTPGDRIAATRCLPRTEMRGRWGRVAGASEQGRCAGPVDLHHQGQTLAECPLLDFARPSPTVTRPGDTIAGGLRRCPVAPWLCPPDQPTESQRNGNESCDAAHTDKSHACSGIRNLRG